jgi:drug/metabolite transporter (DMT)-like permease
MSTAAPATDAEAAVRQQRAARRGLWLGVLGVAIFAFSIPMSRLASGSDAAPQLHPLFVAFGRAALAGLLAILYLVAVRARRPQGGEWKTLFFTAAGVVVGWPVFLGLAVRHVEATHASVISGILPLATAVIAARALRQHPSRGFWIAAVAGCALVVAFALLRSFQAHGHLGVGWADGLLLLAVLSAAAGYVSGARLSSAMPPEHVISWVLVLSLPLTLPVAALTWPETTIRPAAWGGFLYVSLFSMWLGFFAWYRALAIGGTVRVSQVQLLQPFLSLLFCAPVLGERIDAMTVGFSLAIIVTVAWSRLQNVNSAAAPKPLAAR